MRDEEMRVAATALPGERLAALIAAGELESDPAQLAALERLDDLARALHQAPARRTGVLAALQRRAASPRGLYIHGPVGRGKTMLMDLFYEAVAFSPKRRCHFHEFMADVHERIGAARKAVEGDPIPHVAGEIAKEAALLCFDEMQVTDIADAMILGRLFERLFDRGVVVVATSNSSPRALYKDGLNRQLFVPFIALIEAHLEVVELLAAKDYRLDKLQGLPLYFCPCDAQAAAELDRHWRRLTGGHAGSAETLRVKGRNVAVPAASMGIARFSFAELCEAPLGALDYLHVAHAYHTIILDRIPVFRPERRAAMRRLITLIDTLYDNGTCLIASAEAEPDALYPQGPDAEMFKRTASRLIEMRSDAYLAGNGARGR
jgi:cell division protein ZapE